MINYVYEQELRKVFNDHTKGFETLLQNNNDACNYHRNVQTLLIEISKKKKVLLLQYHLQPQKF